jgi:hypothetical protein
MNTDYPPGPLFLEPRLVYDCAFLGWGRRPADPTPIAVYDWTKVRDACRVWHAMTFDEADEFVSVTIEAAWLGPGTPLLLQTGSITELEDLL